MPPPRAEAQERPARHRDFCRGMAQLGLWHAYRLRQHGHDSGAAFADVLSRHVDLYRLTTLWDGERDVALGHDDPRWRELLDTLAALAARSDAATFEREAIEHLEPLLRDQPEPPPDGAIGSFAGTVVGEGIADVHRGAGLLTRASRAARRAVGLDEPQRHLELHFFNACRPRSPFADPATLIADLRALVQRVRAAQPQVTTVWCNTWLNDCERFVRLFPPQWRQSAVVRTPTDVDRASRHRARLNTANWWGQFQRADGSLHPDNAARFRQHGVFAHPCSLCCAPLDAVVRHLDELAAARGGAEHTP